MRALFSVKEIDALGAIYMLFLYKRACATIEGCSEASDEQNRTTDILPQWNWPDISKRRSDQAVLRALFLFLGLRNEAVSYSPDWSWGPHEALSSVK